MLIRHADPERDAADCAAIYAPFVSDSPVSMEETPLSSDEMADRIRSMSGTYPWLVAEHDGETAGYAYASQHRVRAAYRWAVDVTVYVAAGHRRRGIGRALYGSLLPLLRDQGFHNACAGITLPNEASVALHESFGFRLVGVYREIAWKAGEWRDVGWWQRRLNPAGDDQPLDPGSPVTLG